MKKNENDFLNSFFNPLCFLKILLKVETPRLRPAAPLNKIAGTSKIPCGKIRRKKDFVSNFNLKRKNREPKIPPFTNKTIAGKIQKIEPKKITKKELMELLKKTKRNWKKGDKFKTGLKISCNFNRYFKTFKTFFCVQK